MKNTKIIIAISSFLSITLLYLVVFLLLNRNTIVKPCDKKEYEKFINNESKERGYKGWKEEIIQDSKEKIKRGNIDFNISKADEWMSVNNCKIEFIVIKKDKRTIVYEDEILNRIVDNKSIFADDINDF